MTLVALPKVGDEIYVPTRLYLSHGRDDVLGGKARVTRVEEHSTWGEQNRWWVYVEEVPDRAYNWSWISRDQAKLREEHGDRRACPDPDDDPRFNTGGL